MEHDTVLLNEIGQAIVWWGTISTHKVGYNPSPAPSVSNCYLGISIKRKENGILNNLILYKYYLKSKSLQHSNKLHWIYIIYNLK